MIRFISLFLLLFPQIAFANSLLIPMDKTQSNHLKAYGLSYMLLKGDIDVDWLLNYRGGSFMVQYSKSVEKECKLRSISYEVLSDAATQQIVSQITRPDVNMDVIKLHKAAKIAVYSPIKISPAEFENTDAVLLVLKYAEIPFEVIYDEEILKGDLPKYDWLHLHHEDFTGQFGRNMRRTSEVDVKAQESIANRFGYTKVSHMKLAVAKSIKEFCAGGGFLFAMCSGAETFDIALAAEGVDIVDHFDGDGVDPQAQSKLDFTKTFAFHNFKLQLDEYDGMNFSDINSAGGRFRGFGDNDAYFSLFDFSAKWDVIPAMLVQNHENLIREFFGQTTAFSKNTVKPSALVMGTSSQSDRYIYGEMGRGQWTFYGGHDPEGRGGGGRRMPTDLNLYPNSPGYRLILNNVLFPSARKKKRKT
ncbi:asparagine synthetase B [Dyadobacter psychrotolerans]|uniref:Asparagine synthetase B n=1 Tax=Dyadobacter psychrotolerans TaxID=2541721 RepID=A0A4R5E153_9BACT|nr:asparagine synthetase B [Dyadobacter psychrotolerans]TDE18361.1 asparagine synthetase B [Dyadobacter psychrotolerans]